ncbi:MAG: hypothetical protein U1E39_04335 [Planctomycetota bacterium]|jgi:hypothetical protein
MTAASPTPAPTPPSPAPAAPPARKPLPWRAPAPKKGTENTPSCNPNYRPPATK